MRPALNDVRRQLGLPSPAHVDDMFRRPPLVRPVHLVPPVPPARLVNLSALTTVGASKTLTAGVFTLGKSPLPLLVRAIGPGLAQFGVADAASSTQLSIYQGGALAVQTNVVTAAAATVAAYDWAFPAAQPQLGIGISDSALVGAPTANSMTAICSSSSGWASPATNPSAKKIFIDSPRKPGLA